MGSPGLGCLRRLWSVLAGAYVSESLKAGAAGSRGWQAGAGCLVSLHVGLSTGLCGPHDMAAGLSRGSEPRDDQGRRCSGGDPTGLRARSLGSLGRSYGLATTPQKDVLINNCFEFVTKEK